MITVEGWLRTRRLYTVQRRYVEKSRPHGGTCEWEIVKEFATIEGAERCKDREEIDAMPGIWEWRIVGYEIGKAVKP